MKRALLSLSALTLLGSYGNKGVTTDGYKKKIVKRELPPDPTAAIFWLKNRQPIK